MSTYTDLRWELAPEGWELWGLANEAPNPFSDRIELLAWVYKDHAHNKWIAKVYDVDFIGVGYELDKEFCGLEEAQAWCVACVRLA